MSNNNEEYTQDNSGNGGGQGFNNNENSNAAYNQGGNNQNGYNQGQYNQGGYNQGAYNQGGYNPGYNQGGYNPGYNQGGYNPGYNNGMYPVQNKPKNNVMIILIVIIVVLLMAGAGVGLYFYLTNNKTSDIEDTSQVVKEEEEIPARSLNPKIANPSTKVAVATTRLRTSPDITYDYNIAGAVEYGDRLHLTGEKNGDGTMVRATVQSGPYRGYTYWIADRYLEDESDFEILNSILANYSARQSLKESRYLFALLDYFKQKGYIGNMTDSKLREIGLDDFRRTNNNQWQFSVTSNPPYPSEYKTQRLINRGSRLEDLAVIITNIRTGDKKLLYFTFDNNENSRLYSEMPVEISKISSINLDSNGNLLVN